MNILILVTGYHACMHACRQAGWIEIYKPFKTLLTRNKLEDEMPKTAIRAGIDTLNLD